MYMLQCADTSLYTGITTDLNRRVEEHNSSPLGAKYTKARRPVILVWYEICATRSEASKREREIKRLTRDEKRQLIE